MTIFEIATIILGAISIFAAVKWSNLKNKGANLFAELKAIREDYQTATQPDSEGGIQITDAEKAKIADHAMKAINDAADIWQALDNLARSLAGIVRKPK